MARPTNGRWHRVRRAILSLGLALTLGLTLVASVGAASTDSEVRIEGSGGVVLIGTPSRRMAELRIPGRETIRLEDARILITRSRVYIAARNTEHTITGFSDRKAISGKFGLLTRIPGYDYGRRDQKPRLRQRAEEWRVVTLTITDEEPRPSASTRESK